MPRDNELPGPGSRESYHLRITPEGGEVSARSSAGLFYAAETLLQLMEGNGTNAFLPEVEIDDYPSLAYRGVMAFGAASAWAMNLAMPKSMTLTLPWSVTKILPGFRSP